MAVVSDLPGALSQFATDNRFNTRGQIAVALHITRCALEGGLPIESSSLIPDRNGRVAGLTKLRVQYILGIHGEPRTLSSAGGSTNRGLTPSVVAYCRFLNELPCLERNELREVEEWWVVRARDFLVPKPLRLHYSPRRTVESAIVDLIAQAMGQPHRPRIGLAECALKHLVGAKIEIVLGNNEPMLVHHGASVADAPTARAGDFVIEQTSIHVTLTPGDAVIAKCIANIGAGLRPILIVPFARAQDALNRAGDMGVRAKLEIIPAEQFLASNIHEWAQFDITRTATSLAELITMYNKIIELAETDRSLLIEM